jgi:alpha/beta superfamily hydrolase
MAYSTGGSSPKRLQEFYNKIESKDKEVMVIPDSHHFDLYYKEKHVTKIVNGMSDLIKRHIN